MKKASIGILMLVLVQFFVFAQSAEVSYSVHMASVGWGGYSSNGETAGTTGQSRQIEAIKVRVNSSISGGVRYDVHASGAGWMGWSSDDAEAGTTGQSRQLEAIRVQLTGELANRFDVQYRVHMASVGWSGWSLNGEDAGTTGQRRQIEAIEIKLAPKGSATGSSASTPIQLGEFPVGKWLDANYDAVWEFSSNNIRILSPSGRVLYNFAGKTIQDFQTFMDGSQPGISFRCREAGRSYRFLKPLTNTDLLMEIDRSGEPHYSVTMEKQ